jgi:hypothetical protein
MSCSEETLRMKTVGDTGYEYSAPTLGCRSFDNLDFTPTKNGHWNGWGGEKKWKEEGDAGRWK